MEDNEVVWSRESLNLVLKFFKSFKNVIFVVKSMARNWNGNVRHRSENVHWFYASMLVDEKEWEPV